MKMTLEQARNFIEFHSWRFARSMPEHPHAYVVREKCRDDLEFLAFIDLIHTQGYDDKFFKMNLRYLQIGQFKYWTMGYRLGATVIINRALIKPEDKIHPWAENPIKMELKPWKEDARVAVIPDDSIWQVKSTKKTKTKPKPVKEPEVVVTSARVRRRTKAE